MEHAAEADSGIGSVVGLGRTAMQPAKMPRRTVVRSAADAERLQAVELLAWSVMRVYDSLPVSARGEV